LEQLRTHRDARLRRQARTLLARNLASDREKVVASYRAALDLEANADRGRRAFRKNCATCHRLENEGHDVGPDLRSAISGKSGEYLLIAILDPSREVDRRYLNYVVTTTTGQMITGLIASETSSSLTLRRGEGVEDTILRSRIETIEATPKSLMPEGLETQLSQQDMADLIAYLQSATR
jgi:putative heme-binding domain-containing protein